MTYDEYLAHHGILGMRWGKRNGPPYPLNSSQMSPKERAKNEVSEYAAKVRVTKRKEKERVRRAKVKEREEVRQNKVFEREQIRQHKVDEKEWARQSKVEDQQNYEAYKRGKAYVTKALLGLGAIGFTTYQVAKFVAKGKAKAAGGA